MSSGDVRARDHPGAEPGTGSLPLPVARVMVEVLRGQTKAPESCRLAVWEGWGGLRTDGFVITAPAFDLPHRRYFLLSGPIEAVLESVEEPPARVVQLGLPWPHYQSASIWWPNDRAWCVATEIDFQSTYVGASRACINAMVEDDRLEVYEVQPSDAVTWASDQVNPKPDESYP